MAEIPEHLMATYRHRVRRETLIFFKGHQISEREMAARINSHPAVRLSDRADYPKISHQAIKGLLDGRACHLNTLDRIREFLTAKVHIPKYVLVPDLALLQLHSAMKRSRSTTELGKIKKDFEGVYEISPFVQVQNVEMEFSFQILVEFDETEGILWCRGKLCGPSHALGTLRGLANYRKLNEEGWPEAFEQYLSGFSYLTTTHFVMHLLDNVQSEPYVIKVPYVEGRIRNNTNVGLECTDVVDLLVPKRYSVHAPVFSLRKKAFLTPHYRATRLDELTCTACGDNISRIEVVKYLDIFNSRNLIHSCSMK